MGKCRMELKSIDSLITCDQVVVEPITQKPQMHRFEGRKMQYVNSVGVGVEIGAGGDV